MLQEARLSLYTAGDGGLVWDRDRSQTGLGSPIRLTTDAQSRLYVADQGAGCVRVYDQTGRPLHTLPAVPDQKVMYRPYAVCVSDGGTMFVSHEDTAGGKYYISMFVPGATSPTQLPIQKIPSRVYSLAVWRHQLVVGYMDGLRLYELN